MLGISEIIERRGWPSYCWPPIHLNGVGAGQLQSCSHPKVWYRATHRMAVAEDPSTHTSGACDVQARKIYRKRRGPHRPQASNPWHGARRLKIILHREVGRIGASASKTFFIDVPGGIAWGLSSASCAAVSMDEAMPMPSGTPESGGRWTLPLSSHRP